MLTSTHEENQMRHGRNCANCVGKTESLNDKYTNRAQCSIMWHSVSCVIQKVSHTFHMCKMESEWKQKKSVKTDVKLYSATISIKQTTKNPIDVVQDLRFLVCKACKAKRITFFFQIKMIIFYVQKNRVKFVLSYGKLIGDDGGKSVRKLCWCELRSKSLMRHINHHIWLIVVVKPKSLPHQHHFSVSLSLLHSPSFMLVCANARNVIHASTEPCSWAAATILLSCSFHFALQACLLVLTFVLWLFAIHYCLLMCRYITKTMHKTTKKVHEKKEWKEERS